MQELNLGEKDGDERKSGKKKASKKEKDKGSGLFKGLGHMFR